MLEEMTLAIMLPEDTVSLSPLARTQVGSDEHTGSQEQTRVQNSSQGACYVCLG